TVAPPTITTDAPTTSVAPRASAAPSLAQPDRQLRWRQALERATDRLAFGQGARCLELLDAAPAPVPAALADQADALRARCVMSAGDCARGRALLDAAGRAHA